MKNMKIAIIFPTYNAAATLEPLLTSIKQQTLLPEHILVVDSSSSDNTTEILETHNIKYYSIKTADFNHGSTRKYATSLTDANIYIFLTQDVCFANNTAIENLVKIFIDNKIGCAYGRQLPQTNANVLAAHLRLFAYPEISCVKSYEDRKRLGIMTCANSDNFAAYRKEALIDVEGMPEDIIFGEDMYIAAKMLMRGWKVAYQANAMIYHSHNYTFIQEFTRYFDTGVFHAMNPWILENFPGHISDGINYLKSLFLYCLKHKEYLSLLKALGSVLIQYLGFLVGRHYKLIPFSVRKKMSMYNSYWDTYANKKLQGNSQGF